MKLALLSIFLALPVLGQEFKAACSADGKAIPCPPDIPKEPAIVEQLKAELAQTKESLDTATKLLQAYAGKYQQCDAQLTSMTVLGPPKQKGPGK